MQKHENMKGIIMKTYHFQEQLGEGTSARVYRATESISQMEVAIKVIPKEYLNSDSKLMQLVKTEITILKNCHNFNVVECKEVFQSEKSIFIVLELCNGFDMEKFLECKGRLQEDYAVMFLKQILNGFKGLHDMRVMHRDFKLANVLLHDEVCKIADLGYAKKFDQEEITYTKLGTKITMAPEVLECKGYSFNADIWSLGVVFYQMLFGKYPYFGKNEQDFLKKIKTKPIDFDNVRISEQARDFIEQCLTYNPKERINWPEIYTHPLINKDSMEIIYGIFNPVHKMEENLHFYQENSQEMELDYENFGIMKSTVRKKLIIEEIQETIGRDIENKNDFEASNLISRNNAIMLGYSKQYVSYFNKLSYAIKFLRLDLLQRSIVVEKNLEIESFLYIVFKKCIIEMKEFHKIVKNKINIFQINYLWEDFQNSQFYYETRETVDYSLKKAEKILRILQDHAVCSSIPDIREEAKFCLLTSEEITGLCDKYLEPVVKNLLEYFGKSEASSDFLEFMEGLLYYMIKDDRGKILPEDFDHMMGRPVQFKDAREDLILRFELFFEMSG